MSLDTSTLYLVATMVAAMLGAMLLFFGRQENIPALRWWGTAYLLGAAGSLAQPLIDHPTGHLHRVCLGGVESPVFGPPGELSGHVHDCPAAKVRRRRCCPPFRT